MSKVNLKNNIWIEGFDTSDECFTPVAQFHPNKLDNVLYEGKTSEIPEDISDNCVKSINGYGFRNYIMPDYNGGSSPFEIYIPYSCKTTKESIQSACDKEFCVIYKID
jgi:hypothetical protein